MTANGVRQTGQGRRGLSHLARQFWHLLRNTFLGDRGQTQSPVPETPAAPFVAEPLKRVRLTDGVSRTLFEEYARHREGESGDEEIGWVLLGLRKRDEAIALATLPAGGQRDAGVAHVRFNSLGQAVGSRVVHQQDPRLTTLGVVHTHPGSLRHPSQGDYEGDSVWVRHLRGGEGVFGIGTADMKHTAGLVAENPRPNVQVFGELCFSWYSLRAGRRKYEPLAVDLTLGPDVARPLHDVWPALEEHAPALERLFRQQAGLRCQVSDGKPPTLAVNVPLAEPGRGVIVLLTEGEVRYLVRQGEQVFAVDPGAKSVDQGVYLLLAELAARDE
jgi:hypothetical protein